jgi:predicted esterase
MFANGSILLSNGHLVVPPQKYKDIARLQNLEDLRFVLDNLSDLSFHHQLKNQIDFTNIALIGHSMGAMSIVNFLKEKNSNLAPKKKAFLKGMLIMDPGNVLEQANYPI